MELASSYLALLHRILDDRHDLQACHTCCRICAIEFLTDRRNAGREDMRCYFGCQEVERALKSTARSIDYNRSAEGKTKRQQRDSAASTRAQLNAMSPVSPVSPLPSPSAAPLPPHSCPLLHMLLPPPPRVAELPPAAPPSLIRHLSVAVSLIERRRVVPREILAVLVQQGIALGRVFAHYRPP